MNIIIDLISDADIIAHCVTKKAGNATIVLAVCEPCHPRVLITDIQYNQRIHSGPRVSSSGATVDLYHGFDLHHGCKSVVISLP